jgi:hypothetical protein
MEINPECGETKELLIENDRVKIVVNISELRFDGNFQSIEAAMEWRMYGGHRIFTFQSNA